MLMAGVHFVCRNRLLFSMFVFLFTRKDLPITAVCPCSWQGGLLAYICLFVELYSCE